jgi:hypothetical protein
MCAAVNTKSSATRASDFLPGRQNLIKASGASGGETRVRKWVLKRFVDMIQWG